MNTAERRSRSDRTTKDTKRPFTSWIRITDANFATNTSAVDPTWPLTKYCTRKGLSLDARNAIAAILDCAIWKIIRTVSIMNRNSLAILAGSS